MPLYLKFVDTVHFSYTEVVQFSSFNSLWFKGYFPLNIELFVIACFCPRTGKGITLYTIDTRFDASTTAFENIVGKGEIARNEQFLLFPQCFLLHQIIASPFVNIFHIMTLFAAEEPKIGI